jgi:hypothetical protein
MGAVENMKEIADFVKKFNDIELNRCILNLENEVLDLSRDKRRGGWPGRQTGSKVGCPTRRFYVWGF